VQINIFSLIISFEKQKIPLKTTFVGFVDFKKAFDSVNRIHLIFKLSKIGIVGKFYRVVSSIYDDPKSRVVLKDGLIVQLG